MAEQWRIGDMALCVRVDRDNPADPVPDALRAGGIYTVKGVVWGLEIHGTLPVRGLALNEVAPVHKNAIGFDARMFRRIAPHQRDAEDDETIRLLNAKPSKVKR